MTRPARVAGPAQGDRAEPPLAATEPPPRRGSSRRRRLLGAVLLLVTIPLLVIGAEAYRVLDAIGEAQDVAVVPLPTREPRTSGSAGHRFAPTPDASSGDGALADDPGDSAAASDLPSAASDDGTSGPAGTAVAATFDQAGPATAEENQPPPPAAGDEADQAPATDGDTSALDVLRELTLAGTDRGDPGQDAVWQSQESVTILVLGVDRRPDGGDQNADVIILARLDLHTLQVHAVGIPRDLLVEIPGYGLGKINGAYNLGVRASPSNPVAGVVLMRDTIEANFGVLIDHYVLVDFAGFEAVVDAVGGIEVTVPYTIRDDAYPTEDYGTEVVVFEPGPQRMDGERALKYARTRNADNDDQRRQRQFAVLLALFDEAKSLGSLTRAADIILALSGAVQTSLPLDAQISLAQIGLALDHDDIFLTAVGQPLVQEGWTDDGAWVYVGDPAEIAIFIQQALSPEP